MIRTPWGVCLSALSSKFAIICVSNSLSPSIGIGLSRREASVRPPSSAAGWKASTTSRAISAKSIGLNAARRAPASIWPMRNRASNVSSTAFNFGDRAIEGASDCVGWRVNQSRLLQAAQDVGEGLAQVMSDVRADVLVGQQKFLDPVKQPVEGARQGGQVVVDRGQRDSAAPVASHNAMRGEPHRVDAAQELGAEPKTSSDAERDRCADRPGESGQNAAQSCVRATLLVADDEDRPVRKRSHQRAQNLGLFFRRFIVFRLLQFAPAGARAARARCGDAQVARPAACRPGLAAHRSARRRSNRRAPRGFR